MTEKIKKTRGGARPGAGRPRGARDSRPRERQRTATPRQQIAIDARLVAALRSEALRERITLRQAVENVLHRLYDECPSDRRVLAVTVPRDLYNQARLAANRRYVSRDALDLYVCDALAESLGLDRACAGGLEALIL